MRIGLNLLYMVPGVMGGTETYARGLLAGLKQLRPSYEFVLFLNRESSEFALDEWSGFQRVVCPVNAINRKDRYVFEHVLLRHSLRDNGIDLLHSLGYTSPLFLKCPTVVTVHDLNFKAFGGSMPIARRLMLGLFVRQAVLRTTKVIAVSDFSRQEILRTYRVPREKVVAIHEAVDLGEVPEFVEEEKTASAPLPGVSGPYVVAFSATYPNKNIPRLIEAFAEAKKRPGFDHKLVLIGHKFQSDRTNAGAERDIIRTGYLDRREVFRVLKGADFLVFPSFYEGFGLPVLESMAAGVPVLCSKAASLPEVAGDAALFFDPFSVRDLAENIAALAANLPLRTSLRQKGFENLKRFSWKKTAAETVAVYDEVLRGM